MPARLFFFDEQKRVWLVRDAVVETRGVAERRVIVFVQLGDSYAKWRVFDLEEPRERRVYRFTGEQHGVSEPVLERQFREARPVGSRQSNAAKPRRR